MVLLILSMLVFSACGQQSQPITHINADPTPTSVASGTIEPPRYLKATFRSFVEIAQTKDWLVKTSDDVVNHHLSSSYTSSAPIPELIHIRTKEKAVQLFDDLYKHIVPVISNDSALTLSNTITVNYSNPDALQVHFTINCPSGSFIISSSPNTPTSNHYIVADDDVTATLKVGEQEARFEATKNGDWLRGWLYLQNASFQFYCMPDTIDLIQDEIDAERLQFARLGDVIDHYYHHLSFASFDEIAALNTAANSSDAVWEAYSADHTLDGLATKADAKAWLAAVNELCLVDFIEEDWTTTGIDCWFTDDHIIEFTLSYDMIDGPVDVLCLPATEPHTRDDRDGYRYYTVDDNSNEYEGSSYVFITSKHNDIQIKYDEYNAAFRIGTLAELLNPNSMGSRVVSYDQIFTADEFNYNLEEAIAKFK